MSLTGSGLQLLREETSRMIAIFTNCCSNTEENTSNHEENIKLFADLERQLNGVNDIQMIEPKSFLAPFLKVIRQELRDEELSALLQAVLKFIQFDLIDPSQQTVTDTVESIVDAVTHARALMVDRFADCYTPFHVIDLMSTLIQGRTASISTKSFEDIMTVYLKLSVEPSSNSVLRDLAQQALENMVKETLHTRQSSCSNGVLCLRKINTLCSSAHENNPLMVTTGLSLLQVTIESGADYIKNNEELLTVIGEELCKNLKDLLNSENLSIFSLALQVNYLIYESFRSHLESQLDVYFNKLLEIIATESSRISNEMRRLVLESIKEIYRNTPLRSNNYSVFIKLIVDFICAEQNAINISDQLLALDILIIRLRYVKKFGNTNFTNIYNLLESAFRFLFNSTNEQGYQAVLTGLETSAFIANSYNLREIFNRIITTLCEFTNLLNQDTTMDTTLTASFGLSSRAEAALSTLFSLLENYGEIVNESRDVVQRVILQLMRMNVVHKLNSDCLRNIYVFSEFSKSELAFFQALIDILSTSKDLKSIITDLELDRFCRGDLLFDGLCRNILNLRVSRYGTGMSALQELTQRIQYEKGNILINQYREIIKDYLKPVEFQVSNTDNRAVIEIRGKNVVLSEILQQLEAFLSKYSIDEIRFIITDIVHVDENIKGALWRGKNVMVLTKNIIIHHNVDWDVSGKDAIIDESYSKNAGTAADGYGRAGKDGQVGESGGNVLILADNMENPINLTITSNGGNAGYGQDGGHGTDGENGKGLSRAEFMEEFPSVIKCFYSRYKRPALVNSTIDKIAQRASTVNTNWSSNGSRYINAITRYGNEITFSYCSSSFFTRYQAYLLYKGTEGKAGLSGGERGLGGQGGLAGEIIAKSLKTRNAFEINAKQSAGRDGQNGKGGLCAHGLNANDMGYVDHQYWRNTIYCKDDAKYRLSYCKTDDAVFCRKHDGYVCIELVSSSVQKNKQYQENIKTRQNSQRQHHAQAVRKINILENKILCRYAQQLTAESSAQKNIQNLLADLENVRQQAIDAITELSQDHQEHVHTTQMHIQRGISYAFVNREERHAIAAQATQITLNDENLLTTTTTNITPNEFISHRFDTLYRIAKQLDINEKYIQSHITPATAAIYLIEENESTYEIFHPDFGLLNQYIFEDDKKKRRKIADACKNIFETNSNARHAMRAFILNVPDSSNIPRTNYQNKYQYLLQKKESGFIVFPESLSRLDQACCNDQNILNDFKKHIKQEGPLSIAYRELLARIFEVNINLYIEDAKETTKTNTKLSLQHCHNPGETSTAMYVLHRGGDFLYSLQIDSDYVDLVSERTSRYKLHEMILQKIESFTTIQQLDVYLNNFSWRTPANGHFNFTAPNLSLANEEENIKIIIRDFPDSDENNQQQILKHRLSTIKFEITGQRYLVNSIAERFSTEGRHVSFQELCHLLNSIIRLTIEEQPNRKTTILNWIVSAYPQRKWTDELFLLHLENYFKRVLPDKLKWRVFLSKIMTKHILLLFIVKLDQLNSGNSITIQHIEELLDLLSKIPTNQVIQNLQELGLTEWIYVLKEKYWFHKLSQLMIWQENHESASASLSEAAFYLLSMENICGTELTRIFFNILQRKLQQQNESSDAQTIVNILQNFHDEKWNLEQRELQILENSNISDWQTILNQIFATQTDRNTMQLIEIIRYNSNTSRLIADRLISIQDLIDPSYDLRNSITENSIEHCLREFRNSKPEKPDMTAYIKLLNIVDQAIMLRRSFKLRSTQRLGVLALLTRKRTLAQISTGEGKSLIVVATTIIKCVFGEKVDIVTSSSVLAERDAIDNQDIYTLFQINVSHNCYEDIEKRKEAYSCNQVIYGILGNFQRDYLLDSFYNKNILGNRTFANVIIDEVDSMLLDNGNNMLYLSHELAALDTIESVYIYIWQWISQPVRGNEDIAVAFDASKIKEAILFELYGIIKPNDIGQLDCVLTKNQQQQIHKNLIEMKVLDNSGRIIKETIDDCLLEQILSSEFSVYRDRLSYLLNVCINRKKFIRVPNFIRPFVEQHLDMWINSAMSAFFMKPGHDYVVDVDRTGTSQDRNPNIIIIDRDTGTDQLNSQWHEGLHQFLQLKHSCKLSMQSLKAIFISNVSFFKKYQHLYGLTGTLGSQAERKLLQQMHDVDFIVIPTSKSKQFHEEKSIVCLNEEQWIQNIHLQVNKTIEEDQRSVLIICETVDHADILHKSFSGGIYSNREVIHTYRRDYEKFKVIDGNKKLQPRQIIIATNLAGRGTDIKISEELKTTGGLHVCVTYLPNNKRIEQQAFGRGARCGDPGSGQLIFYDTKLRESTFNNAMLFKMKNQRDLEELHRISLTKTFYETQIIVEEKCLDKFTGYFKNLREKLTALSPKVRDMLLHSCLDKWAFWIDTNAENIKSAKSAQERRSIEDRLDEFISNLEVFQLNSDENRLDFLDQHPVYMLKFGKNFIETKNYNEAIKVFDKVIQQEPIFSEAAHFYKAFAIAMKINWKKNPLQKKDKVNLKLFKNELREAAQLSDEHSRFCIKAAAIVGRIKWQNKENTIEIDAYEEQKRIICNIYHTFTNNIDDILGKPFTMQSLINCGISAEFAEILFRSLIKQGFLKGYRLKREISEKQLKAIANAYRIPMATLTNFLSDYQRLKDIDEQKLKASMKTKIPLPSREQFWKILIQNGFLTDEVKYVIINKENLPSDIDAKINESDLINQTVKCGYHQIVLRAEQLSQISQQNNDSSSYIFKKAEFLRIFTQKEYKALKKNGMISLNRKANANLGNIHMCNRFPNFDSITQNDFTNKIHISNQEAEKVLSDLVENGVIDRIENSTSFTLNVEFKKFKETQFASYPIYGNAVSELINICFSYRVAFQRLVQDLEENNPSICLQLVCKPHRLLLSELLDKRIIKPPTVAKNISEGELKNLLDEKVGQVEMLISSSQTVKAIQSTLSIHQSLLTRLEGEHQLTLKPLSAAYILNDSNNNADEIRMGFLDRLDQVISLGHDDWGWKDWINTIIVIAIGLVQVALGAVQALYSSGLWATARWHIINEGINDVIYAASAIHSGYFSWEDYTGYKLRSVLISSFYITLKFRFEVSNYCLGLFTGFREFSHKEGLHLEKVITKNGPSQFPNWLNFGSAFVLRTTNLIYEINKLSKKIIVFGLKNTHVDDRIKNELQTICKDVTSCISKNIKRTMESLESSMLTKLKEACRKLGKTKTETLCKDLTKRSFTEFVEKFIVTAKKIEADVIQGISEAMEKTTYKLEYTSVWSQHQYHTDKIKALTESILNEFKLKIEAELNREDLKETTKMSEKDVNDFTEDTIKKYSLKFTKNIENVMSKHIVDPLYVRGSKCMVNTIEKSLKMGLKSNYGKSTNYFNNMKNTYREELRNEQQRQRKPDEIERHFTEMYYKYLLELKKISKDHNIELAQNNSNTNNNDNNKQEVNKNNSHDQVKELISNLSIGGDEERPQRNMFGHAVGENRIVEIPADEVHSLIESGRITFSQDTIGDHTRDNVYIGELSENISQNGYNGDPVRIVQVGSRLVALDHRRLLAAAITNSSSVMIPFEYYHPDDELTQPILGQTTAGDALRRRMATARTRDRPDDGFPASRVTVIRKNENNNHPSKESIEEKLKRLGFTVRSKMRSSTVPNPRSNNDNTNRRNRRPSMGPNNKYN